jgi:hypothetical protein
VHRALITQIGAPQRDLEGLRRINAVTRDLQRVTGGAQQEKGIVDHVRYAEGPSSSLAAPDVGRMLWSTLSDALFSAGANVKVVQKLLGPKTAVLTLDRYGHLFPDDLDAVADAFDAAAQSTADRLRTGKSLRVARSDKNSR